MVDVVEPANARTEADEAAAKSWGPLPSWLITTGSLGVLLGVWEIFGRDINPVFGSYTGSLKF